MYFTVSLHVMSTPPLIESRTDYSATDYSVTRTFQTYVTVGSRYQQCLQLNIINDTIGETTESFTVHLSSSNSRVMIQNGQSVATVIIVDDDSEYAVYNI